MSEKSTSIKFAPARSWMIMPEVTTGMKQPRCAGVLGLAATARQSKTLQKEYHTRERAIGEKKLGADKENEESDGGP